MKKTKHSHNLKWYFIYSVFALFIVVGVFSIMYSYAAAINAQLEFQKHINVITANTIENFMNDEPPIYAPQANLLGNSMLIIFGIAGFLFTKFLYEKQVMHSV